MKKKTNLLELLVWAALVSFIVMQPAHSQSVNNGQPLFGDSTWSGNFDMGASFDAAGNPADAAHSTADQGDMGHQTIKTAKAPQPWKSPKASLAEANNGNITLGSYFGYTSIPSGSYNFGFTGGMPSFSPFNTGLPACSTGSVDLNICE